MTPPRSTNGWLWSLYQLPGWPLPGSLAPPGRTSQHTVLWLSAVQVMGWYMLPQNTDSGTPLSCQWNPNWSVLAWSIMKLPPTMARYASSGVPSSR